MKSPTKRRFLAAGLVALGAFLVPPALLFSQPARTADPSFAPVADRPGLPQVLLIGDSISMGYTLLVREKLEGKANVHRPAENCSESAKGLARLDTWLGNGKWDVVHFNFGLHDLKYVDEKGAMTDPDKGKQVALLPAYEKNLRELVVRLQKTGAKLIFATTTPVPAGSQGRVAQDELHYNEVAVRVMKELGVAIDDLHAVITPRQAKLQRANNVHFINAGYELLAEQVVASIEPVLPPPAK